MNQANGTVTKDSQKKTVNKPKGQPFTKRGMMPPDKVAKHKLLPVIAHEFAPKYAMTDAYRQKIGRMIRLTNNIRVATGHLPCRCPAQVKDAVHYFAHVATKDSSEG